MYSKKINQADIAKLLNKEKSVVSQWIKYDRIPSAEYALKIADLLEVDIRYLVTGKEQPDYSEDLQLINNNPDLKAVLDLIKHRNKGDLKYIRAAIEACVALGAATQQPETQQKTG
jgi:transcriptional regulator with XRE-family HTH domain